MRTSTIAVALFIVSFTPAACGGGGGGGGSAVPSAPSTPSGPPPPHVVSVSIASSPSSLQIDAKQTEALTATVTGDSSSKGVNWFITCQAAAGCGSMSKASSSSGERVSYIAPAVTIAEGAFPVTVTAGSAADATKTASVIVLVAPPLALVTPPPAFPSANVGMYFEVSLPDWIEGGVGDQTWRIKSGTMPSGLQLNTSTGQIGGLPTSAMRATVVITVTDSGNPPMSVDLLVSLVIGPMLPLSINPLSGALPDGNVGTAYNKRCSYFGLRCYYGLDVSVSGGMQPYAFAWAPAKGSSLAPGLTLQTVPCGGTCTQAYISGTPTTAGQYVFTVTATDSESPQESVSANYTIAVH